MIDIQPVAGKAMLEQFIRLPYRLQRGDPAWVPPLLMERREALSARKNPLFRQAEVCFWLARRDGRAVGRISAQIDRRLQADGREGIGHFGMLAGEDDPAVFAGLVGAAEAWLRSRGIGRVLGPFNLSINEEAGLLVDGHDTPPMLMMGHDAPYVAGHLERLGYAKEKDLLAYLYDLKRPLPAAITARMERTVPANLRLRPVDMRRFDQEVQTLVDIFNDAWSDNWGFLPFSRDEAHHLGRSMRPLVDRRLIWFAEVDGEAAGFIVGLPNLNAVIADLDGRLLPFGWAKLLWRLKVRRPTSARVPLMGIRRRFGHGLLGGLLPFLLIGSLRREGEALGYRHVELSWILEDNQPMRRINEVVGSVAYKTYRVYGKSLG
ncbi:hypothetical protein STVA_11390 [Allostella vacuolata]|nr:hypothetical protein STVA_11390 [Stella vacuolata]